MEITFLGGANEIGASCAVVDFDSGTRLLVDCGQRLGSAPGMQLPDFSFLEQGPPIKAVLLTHAHIDHIGGLPALDPFLPEKCPIFATTPTLSITRVMLQDSVRTMTLHRQGPGQLPLYPPAAVTPVLARMRGVRWGRSQKVASDTKAQWFPSGHILGAAMIEIRCGDESVVFSGDLSVADQITVSGAFVPSCTPDILVLESTYGNRQHVHRPLQEKRLIERVGEILDDGGSVLFPSFALGRAQEVLLLLGRAMREGELRHAPVYADGMVRRIAHVYAEHGDELGPFCRKLWEQGIDPVFPDDLPIQPVAAANQRQKIASGEPCIVVASGGMLQGGASQFYAKLWLSDPKHLVALTGYQDEESPGHALLELAAQRSDAPRSIELEDVVTEVKCHIENHSLSAHADGNELTSIASKLKPRLVLPVHGDEAARNALARRIREQTDCKVVLPQLGGTYSLRPRGKVPERKDAGRSTDLLAMWPPWDPYEPRELNLETFHAWISRVTPRVRTVSLEDIAGLWKSPNPPTDEDLAQVRQALANQDLPYFVPDERRPLFLHVTPADNLRPPRHRADAAKALNVARELFPQESGLLRVGLFPDEGVAQLVFRFPEAITEHQQGRLHEFTHRTDWRWEVRGTTRPADLQELLHRWLASGVQSGVEIDPHRHIVRAAGEPLDSESVDALAERFYRRSGYRLELRPPGAEAVGE
jgi:Cft2 family RNA processing exonuclease